MKGGCFKNFFATIGCVTALAAVAISAWVARPQIRGLYESIGEGDSSAQPTSGFPSDAALRSAEEKEAAIARPDGVGYISLTADEMASLIERRLDPRVRANTDSVRVALMHGRLVLEGQILTEVLGADVLGPLSDLLGSRQPIRVGGVVSLREPGVVAWVCDEFVIRAFPFPPSAIPRLVNRLSGDSAGAFLIPIPETVGEVHVEPDRVTFFRQVG